MEKYPRGSLIKLLRTIIMSSTIPLNCWTLGEDPGRIFPVEIERTKSVGALKDAIKDKKRPVFDHVAADALVLWNVSVPADEDFEENLKKLNLYSKPPLQPLTKLSSVFADQHLDDHLDIVVKAPPTGELETLSVFVILHDFISHPS
jgi:hypothetical protein